MSFPASRLQRVLNEPAVPFKLGDYISQGFEFMNKNFGMLLGFMLVSTFISLFAQLLPFVGFVLSILIAPVFQIGYAQFTFAVKKGAQPEFGEFFKGFNKVGPLVITYILMGLITLAALLPGLYVWYQAGMVDWLTGLMAEYPFIENVPDIRETVDMSLFGIGAILMVVATLAIGLLFTWSLNLVWFFEITPMEALSASRKLISRNWVSYIIFVIIAGFIAASGALLCGVGALYTAPAMAIAQVFAFADATRLFEGDEQNQADIIDHFIA